MCSLITSSWMWHPDSIVCLAQTCQAWLSAQQDWCLVRSYVSTAIFRRAIKIKVTATALLHETWVHRLFHPDATRMDPYCNESHIFVQVLHTFNVLFINPLIFRSPTPVITKKKLINLQHKNKINVSFPKVTIHQNVSKNLHCLKKLIIKKHQKLYTSSSTRYTK